VTSAAWRRAAAALNGGEFLSMVGAELIEQQHFGQVPRSESRR
jgi:hypothetical protein